VGQLNENDNNKNRKYPEIEARIRETYVKASTATNKNALWDPYVKFFRWATDRLHGHDGIVCFVSNNSFVDQIAFDGMRKHLMEDFTHIDHIDLHGNVRKNPKLSGTTHNVFGIQVGVGITLAVRCNREKRLRYHRVPEFWRREEKLAWLADGKIQWEELTPNADHTWLIPEHSDDFAAFLPITDILSVHSPGVKTNRDDVVYDYNREVLAERVKRFAAQYNSEVDRYSRTEPKPLIDDFVDYTHIKWSRDLKQDVKRGNYVEFADCQICRALYRPFTQTFQYFDRILNEEVYRIPEFFPADDTQNVSLAVTDIAAEKPFMVMATDKIPDFHLVGAGSGCQCFPLDHITDRALKTFSARYRHSPKEEEVFHYVYAILHHPGYRRKFADNLKRELPRIPLAPDFHAFACAGRELARLHLDYERLEPWPLEWIHNRSEPLSYRVEKMRLNKDKTALAVNSSLTLASIPCEAFEYRLGNRSALEWVIDQYQVTEDARSGIRSDPNRDDAPEYIVRLIGQVIRVSMETVKIVRSLPQDFSHQV
jgi:predicted helicase